MAATTTLLGLVTPTQGTLTGTWGDTVNYGISDYLDIAIAGTLSFAGDGAITLANTTGSSSGNSIGATTAQYMVIRVTGTQTITKIITGPSYSKLYMVDHAGATSAVTFKAAGQTGVSVAVGEKCFVYYNGTDYVKVASSVADGVTTIDFGSTGLTPNTATSGAVTVAGTLAVANGGTGLTAGTSGGVLAFTATGTLASSTALAASALVIGGGAGAAPSTTTTGTGVVTALGVNVGSAGAFVVNGGALGSPSSVGTMPAFTLGGTVSGGGNQINNVVIGTTTPLAGSFTTLTTSSTVTVNGGTANGVAYLDGSKVLTTGSALTFDGSSLVGTGKFQSQIMRIKDASYSELYFSTADSGGNGALSYEHSSNSLRIYADGGIRGTFSSTGLAVTGTLSATGTLSGGTSGTAYSFSGSAPATSLTLDASGRLGIGVSNPSVGIVVSYGTDGIIGNYYSSSGANSRISFSNTSLLNNNVSIGSSSDAMVMYTAATERARIDTSGNLGVGTSSPSSYGVRLVARGAASVYGDERKVLSVVDTTALAAGVGGGISFYGVSESSGAETQFGSIKGIKENATSANYAGALAFVTSSSANVQTERMRLDSAGNLGLGVTPSAWLSGSPAMQFKYYGSIWNASDSSMHISENGYYNGSDWIYLSTAAASNYYQTAGTHIWRNAASGTAGNAISFTQAMTLDASGNLGIGETSPSIFGKLVVKGGTINLVTDTAAQRRVSFWSQGNGNSENAYIQAQNDGATTNTGEILFATRNSSGTLAERARIDASGNLGIGTTSPTFTNGKGIAILDGTTSRLKLATTASGSGATDGFELSCNGSEAYIYNYENSFMAFGTNNTERARIDSSGNLLVGKTATGLGTAGIEIFGTGIGQFTASGDASLFTNRLASDGDTVKFYRATSLVGSISVTTSATAYNTSSDYRLKNSIAPMTGALAKVALLKPCTYKWNADGSDGQGFIAHELAEVVPQCVTGEKDAVNEDGSIKSQGIDTSFLVATLTAAIQEQQALITQLTARVAQLESKP